MIEATILIGVFAAGYLCGWHRRDAQAEKQLHFIRVGWGATTKGRK